MPDGAPDQLVEIGLVARAHGVRGELRIRLHNPASSALDRAEEVVVGGTRYRLEAVRPVEGACLVRLAGVADRDQAEALRGRPVLVARAALDLEPDEVLLTDLVGCAVELIDGRPWGRVAAVEPGPQDRLIIHDGAVERQLPVADAFIVEIDLQGGRVVVDPPEGLPEEPLSPAPRGPARP